jgi:hypothetical protein
MQDFIDTLINGPARYTQANNLSDGWTLLVILGALLVEICLIIYLVRLLFFFVINIPSLVSFLLRLLGVAKRDVSYTFMQLTFPSDTSKSAYATEQLHILLRSLVGYRNIWERFAARKRPYSLEVVATKDEGIRYVIRVPSIESEQVHSMLLSFLPGLKVKMIDDYMDNIDGQVCSAELMLAGDYVLPLGVNKALNEHDPVAYLTGHMRNLHKGEIAAYQIVAVPVFDNKHRILLRRIRRFITRIAQRKTVSSELMNERDRIRRFFLISVFFPLYILAKGLKFIGQIIGTILHNDIPEEWKSTVSAQAPLNPYEQELGASVKEKIDQSVNLSL